MTDADFSSVLPGRLDGTRPMRGGGCNGGLKGEVAGLASTSRVSSLELLISIIAGARRLALDVEGKLTGKIVS